MLGVLLGGDGYSVDGIMANVAMALDLAVDLMLKKYQRMSFVAVLDETADDATSLMTFSGKYVWIHLSVTAVHIPPSAMEGRS
jgi:hypothetical protein